jgi:hypothetical protein
MVCVKKFKDGPTNFDKKDTCIMGDKSFVKLHGVEGILGDSVGYLPINASDMVAVQKSEEVASDHRIIEFDFKGVFDGKKKESIESSGSLAQDG